MRYATGRIGSHEKLYQIKQEVQKIKDQEFASNSVLEKKTRGITGEEPEMEDQFNVQIGTPFDYIFKERAELIDSQKMKNNKKMDELVAQLGYMDYRDALACNKYILETKRSGDYHQLARGRVLEFAFNRLEKEKQLEIREKANQTANTLHAA